MVRLRAPTLTKARTRSRQASLRYRIETANGQLAGRIGMKQTRVRGPWYLTNCVAREVLGHPVLCRLTAAIKLPPIFFARLFAA